MTRSTTTRSIVTGSAAVLLLLTACGSDDDASAASAEACDAWIAADDSIIGLLFTGQGDAASVNAALDSAIAAAPDDVVDTITELKSAAQPQLEDPESEASDETSQLYRDTVVWAGESCAVETLDVTAVDYEFEGVPDDLTTGYHVLDFSNDGQERHEIVAFKINDGVAESLDEIFAGPEEEIFAKITPVNVAFAAPGETDTVSWNLRTPGNYAVLCFIPVGSVGETEGDGPPHFVEGMVQEFTVTS